MRRLYSIHDFKFYTHLKQILCDLELANKQYLWLISDIEAYPRTQEYQQFLLSIKRKIYYSLICHTLWILKKENIILSWINLNCNIHTLNLKFMRLIVLICL